MIGQTVSHYRIESQLGKGGMGVVYRAVDTRLDRTVALKFLPPHLSSDEVAMKRFMAEAKAASALDDPHICTIYDIGETADGRLFIVMSYYDGGTLRYRLQEGPVPIAEAISIARQLAGGLATAHAAGIVHRDVKPANIMVTSSGQVKLLDFGVAKFHASVDLTKDGSSVGTAAYMSPEQTRGESVDGRADIWSVGAVLYEMLAGRLPFSAGYDAALMYAILNESATPLEDVCPDIDPELCAVVNRCLSREPADRFGSAAELLEALIPFAPVTAETQLTSVPGSSTALTSALIRTAAIFCVSAGVVLAAVYAAMIGLGLPGWLFPAGVILMLIGLPIVLYAVHTERTRAKLDSSERARLSGLRAWLTTRRAVRGGFVSMGGLGAVTALFMVLRMMGVGPFATLISGGQLDKESIVVLADFNNRTTDPAMGTSVTQAFRIDLAQSAAVNMMDGSRVTAALVRMQRDPGSPIDAELAREIAIREGAKAYIVGDVGPAGSGYVFSTAIHLASDGSQLVGLRESAASDDDVLKAIDKLSARLREKVGESLVQIRAEKPLYEVTTPSLEALRLYSDAQDLTTQSDDRGAIQKLEEALELDSTFAMAWRKLAIVHSNLGDPVEFRRLGATKAFESRANATERERLQIDALYYLTIEGDRERSQALYESLLEKWPYDAIALVNLQGYYNSEGRFAESEVMARRALESNDGWVYRNALLRTLQNQGKYDEAHEALEAWADAFPRDRFMTGRKITQAWLDGNPDTVRVLIDSLRVRTPSEDSERSTINRTMSWAAETGHAKEYIAARKRDAEIDAKRGARASVVRSGIGLAMFRLRTLQDPAGARAELERTLAETPLDSFTTQFQIYLDAAAAYTYLGDLAMSEALVAEYEAKMPSGQRGFDLGLRLVRARNKVLEGDSDAGVSDLEEIVETLWCFRPCHLLFGEFYMMSGRTEDAIASFERAVNMPSEAALIGDGQISLTFETLGELFATTGDLDKAIDYLSRFVDWWKDADPELQPRVQAARDRIEELMARKRAEPSSVG